MFKPRRNKKGFTIIELIVVIAILAILAAIAIPSFVGITERAEEKVALANARMIVNSINSYNMLNPTDQLVTTQSTIKDKLSAAGTNLWPVGIEDEAAAWVLVNYTTAGDVATIKTTAAEPATS